MIGQYLQESSITEEVEAELRPASSASSHTTPLLASRKLRQQPRDESLPSPRSLLEGGGGRLPLPSLAPSGSLNTVLFRIQIEAKKTDSQNFTCFCFNCTETTVECSFFKVMAVDWFFFWFISYFLKFANILWNNWIQIWCWIYRTFTWIRISLKDLTGSGRNHSRFTTLV